jgi:ABC-2 type transport system permease protein
MRGLWKLTWLELKIFAREPLGLLGSVAMPVVVFVALGRSGGAGGIRADRLGFLGVVLPVFTSILIVLGAVLSLVTIISIYRESGILKRLRATPLRATTILSAHVLVKLLTTGLTMAAMIAAGRRYLPPGFGDHAVSFTAALLLSTVSMLSIGFVIASLVPTARFAQPIGSLVFYPMIAVSGLFFPIESLPPALERAARLLPLSYVVSLLRGIWTGEPWSAHAGDVAALGLVLVLCVAVSARVFRWE